MALYVLDDKITFPPVEEALEDGLLAIGGDLSIERILLAYRKGIFPWFSGDIPLWWSPDPRCVLFPDELIISKSMKQLLKKEAFDFTMNEAFKEVMMNCQKVKRKEEDGTWITNDFVRSYTQLHKLGYAESAEVWLNDELVGGLYGVMMGKVFCGESMFSKVSNASKYALIKSVEHFKQKGIEIIDCQVHTPHLESLGARLIPRKEFLSFLS
jgi:leucyl/phenylalanyl-tRNA--protein transferase